MKVKTTRQLSFNHNPPPGIGQGSLYPPETVLDLPEDYAAKMIEIGEAIAVEEEELPEVTETETEKEVETEGDGADAPEDVAEEEVSGTETEIPGAAAPRRGPGRPKGSGAVKIGMPLSTRK